MDLKTPLYDPERIRVFLSYSTIDKKPAGHIKRELDRFGFQVFLAHEDIEPSQNWIKEIISSLNNCDIFVPFLTQNSQNSFWVNQEIGIAFSLNKLIMPFKTDENPKGFINFLQAQALDQIDNKNFNSNVNRACDKLRKISFENFPDKINDSLIYALGRSTSYIDSNNIAGMLFANEKFNEQQINEIFKIFLLNDQVTKAGTARKFIKILFNTNQDIVDPRTLRRMQIELQN